MKWLTYLDFSLLQKTSKNIEFKLEEKEKEISYLKERDSLNSETVTSLSDKVFKMARTNGTQEVYKEIVLLVRDPHFLFIFFLIQSFQFFFIPFGIQFLQI